MSTSLTLPVKELKRVIMLCQSYSDGSTRKSTISQLSNILLSIEKNLLQLTSSHLNVSTIVRTSEVSSTSSGIIAVPGKLFTDIVRELPDGEVSITLEKNARIRIICGPVDLKINGESSDSYPVIPGVSFEPKEKINSDDLKRIFVKTLHAASNEENRFVLNGICVHKVVDGDIDLIRAASTDGFRLATSSIPFVNIFGDKGEEIIVPKKSISSIVSFLDDVNGEQVLVGVEKGFFVISHKTGKCAVALVDGEYPSYERAIPSHDGKVISIAPGSLISPLKRVSLFVSTEKTPLVALKFTEGNLEIAGASSLQGEGKEDIEVDYNGPEVTLAFNSKYLLDAVNNFSESPSLALEFFSDDVNLPLIVRSEGDTSSQSLVMSVNLQNEE